MEIEIINFISWELRCNFSWEIKLDVVAMFHAIVLNFHGNKTSSACVLVVTVDGVPMVVEVLHINIGLCFVMIILSVAGLLFSTVCIVFNLVFSNKR